MSESGDKKATPFDFTLDDHRPHKAKKTSRKRQPPYLMWDRTRAGRGESPAIWTLDDTWSSSGNSCQCCTCHRISICLFTLIFIAVLSVVATTIFIGVSTSDQLLNNIHLRGRLKIISGDQYSSMLDDPRSKYHRHKTRLYEDKLRRLYEDSSLRDSIQAIRVYGFRNGSLIVLFGLFVDRMTMPEENRDSMKVMKAVKKVLMTELMSPHPKVFGDVMVDPHSVVLSDFTGNVVKPKEIPDNRYYIMHNDEDTTTPSSATVAPTLSLSEEMDAMYRANSEMMEHAEALQLRPFGNNDKEDPYKYVDRQLEIPQIERDPGNQPTTQSANNVMTTEVTAVRDDDSTSKSLDSTQRSVDSKSNEVPNISFNYDPWQPLLPATIKSTESPKKSGTNRPISLDDIPPQGKPYNIPPRGKPMEMLPLRKNDSRHEIPEGHRKTASFDDSKSSRTVIGPTRPVPTKTLESIVRLSSSVPSDDFVSDVTIEPTPAEELQTTVHQQDGTESSSSSSIHHPSSLLGSGDVKVTPTRISLASTNHNKDYLETEIKPTSVRNSESMDVTSISPIANRNVSSLINNTEGPSEGTNIGKVPLTDQNFDEQSSVGLKSVESHDESPQSGSIAIRKNSRKPKHMVFPVEDDGIVAEESAATKISVSVADSSGSEFTLLDRKLLVGSDWNEDKYSIGSSDKTVDGSASGEDVTGDQGSKPSKTQILFNKYKLMGSCKGFKCNTGECISKHSRCDQIRDCWDKSDEKNCRCVDQMRVTKLEHKICDGIPDCEDFSDEEDCYYCKPGQFVCPNSRRCINQSQVCDGMRDCPDSADESKCMMLSPGPSLHAGQNYHNTGYLMVRRNGIWGHMCMDRFARVRSDSGIQLTLGELGQVVCKQLTYRNTTEVEVVDVSRPQKTQTEYFYNFQYNEQMRTHTVYSRSVSEEQNDGVETSSVGPTNLSLLPEKKCLSRRVLHVTCEDLECGIRPNSKNLKNYRIVGGESAEPGSWPWHAALYKEGKYQCGASLISDRWLLSAGHCFNNFLDKYWVARLGLLRRGANNIKSPYEQIRRIVRIKVHENYIESGFVNDITLLKMDQPVTFSDYIRPVCLPTPGLPIQTGRMCTVIGWGQLYEIGSIYPDSLQEVKLPLIDTETCRKRTVFVSVHSVTDNQFCAGYERGGRDACVGDSGGPILCQENTGQWTLLGVTSNGFGCARPGYPGVYTKVSDYLKWISYVMGSKYEREESKLFCAGHRCPLGKCLPPEKICDGRTDCRDGSDEKTCHRKSNRQFG